MSGMLQPKPVIILGAGRIGTLALDIFQRNGVEVYCFLDDDAALHDQLIGEISVLGRADDEGYLKFIGKKCGAFVASDEVSVLRKHTELVNDLRHEASMNALHPDASLSPLAEIGYGILLGAGAVIEAFAKVEGPAILHSRAVVSTGATIAPFVIIGPGAVVGPGVTVEEGAFIGAGAVLAGEITIGKNARVGAGSVVIGPVEAKQTVFGNPAQPWKG